MKKAKKRAKVIRRLMRNVWGSLDSHLKYTYKKGLPKEESNEFHKQCIREYSQAIKDISELY
jgi:ppGpp synthetase/RelA/SpoT-type nucleotidyltranferase